MSKVKITKKQAEFIEGFKKPHYLDNEAKVVVGESLPIWAGQVLHNLTQYGFGKGLEDANGIEIQDDFNDSEGNFQHDQVPLLIEAIMHGYEIEEEKVVLFIEFSDEEYSDNRKLYYGAGVHVTNKFSATEYDLNIKWEEEKVEELKKQGWKVEEV